MNETLSNHVSDLGVGSSSTSSNAWMQNQAAVREFRRKLSGLSTFSPHFRNPNLFAFRTFSDLLRTRIYFLASMMGKENTLLYVDIDDSSPATPIEVQLSWTPLIESSFQICPTQTKLSKEEQLLSERKRCVTWGISEFELHEESGRFMFPAASSIYTCLDNGVSTSGSSTLFPNELKTSDLWGGVRLSPSVCPTNPNLVAFGKDGDVWVTHATSAQEVRLTSSRCKNESGAITAGLPSYVMQEEFNRYNGFWWRPCSEGDRYCILYEEVDESEVDIVRLSPNSGGEVEEFRFPKPGENNAKSKVKLVYFNLRKGSEEETICDVQTMDLTFPLEAVFPWLEYIPRLGWTPDGESVWVQTLNRRQQLIQLVLIPPSAFRVAQNGRHELTNGDARSVGQSMNSYQVILQQQTDTWITINDILEFIQSPTAASHSSSSSKTLEFIWASDETGWRHLYHFTVQIFSDVHHDLYENENFLRPRIIRKVALTSGEWAVTDKSIWIDRQRKLVYFQACKDTPLEKHLYAVSMIQPDHIVRLTNLGYSHCVQMNKDCSLFVSAFSSIRSLPGCEVLRINHTDSTVDGIHLTLAGYITKPKAVDDDFQTPELFEHVISSGDKLYGMIFKPPVVQPHKQYPVVLSVYGGPEVQLVTNSFKGIRMMRNHLLASQGFVVVCIDSRGSQNRGTAFESHIRHRMGQVEMRDQVETLQWLLSNSAYMDSERIAVHGWSYGGYLSLMGILQYPEFFKVSIAGAPVVNWMNYDTGYTERYMDLPAVNEDGYKQGSILERVKEFPDEPNRVLIVHGLKDENVHFASHSTLLISQLIKHGKPYQLQIYPDERHSLRHFEASEHYEITLLSFLKNNL